MDEIKKETAETLMNNFDEIFVTENDTFEVKVKFYKKEDAFFIEGIDDEFDVQSTSKEICLTLKYPSQGDTVKITGMQPKLSENTDEITTMRTFLSMELSRLSCLMRKWNLNKELSVSNVMSLNPKIVKSLLIKIREKIGTDGIL